MALQLVSNKPNKPPISAEKFFDELFSSQEFYRIEGEIRRMREAFQAPWAIANHEQFRSEMLRFHAHVHRSLSNIQGNARPDIALHDVTRWYGEDLGEAERNALYGRDGGFIGVVDKMTEKLLEEAMASHFAISYFDYIPNDQFARIRLAKEVIARYGHVIYGANLEDMKVPEILASHIEQVITMLAKHFHAMRKNPLRF